MSTSTACEPGGPRSKDYRVQRVWGSAGRGALAREGLESLWPKEWGGTEWGLAAVIGSCSSGKAYRAGHSKKESARCRAIKKVYEKGGKLSVAELLRLRVRYFTDGVVIGTRGFVEEIFRGHYQHHVPGARAERGG